MNILLFGPQGSGKGTQADMLSKELNLYHLSMGEELRKEIKGKTAIGKKVESIMARGDLVPVSITSDIVLKRSKSKECKNGIIFDGYPRSSEQWEFAKKNFKIDAAIELNLSEKESVRRIASRRVCPKCGKNYNIIYLKPKVTGRCDDDKTKLIQREDDTPKAVKDRLRIYHTQTEPLKKEYKKLGILKIIDGKQPIKKVYADMLKVLKKK
ncbi:MAG: adenylate kinase family protein [Candidatus Woesearchaeota archaeon]